MSPSPSNEPIEHAQREDGSPNPEYRQAILSKPINLGVHTIGPAAPPSPSYRASDPPTGEGVQPSPPKEHPGVRRSTRLSTTSTAANNKRSKFTEPSEDEDDDDENPPGGRKRARRDLDESDDFQPKTKTRAEKKASKKPSRQGSAIRRMIAASPSRKVTARVSAKSDGRGKKAQDTESGDTDFNRSGARVAATFSRTRTATRGQGKEKGAATGKVARSMRSKSPVKMRGADDGQEGGDDTAAKARGQEPPSSTVRARDYAANSTEAQEVQVTETTEQGNEQEEGPDVEAESATEDQQQAPPTIEERARAKVAARGGGGRKSEIAPWMSERHKQAVARDQAKRGVTPELPIQIDNEGPQEQVRARERSQSLEAPSRKDQQPGPLNEGAKQRRSDDAGRQQIGLEVHEDQDDLPLHDFFHPDLFDSGSIGPSSPPVRAKAPPEDGRQPQVQRIEIRRSRSRSVTPPPPAQLRMELRAEGDEKGEASMPHPSQRRRIHEEQRVVIAPRLQQPAFSNIAGSSPSAGRGRSQGRPVTQALPAPVQSASQAYTVNSLEAALQATQRALDGGLAQKAAQHAGHPLRDEREHSVEGEQVIAPETSEEERPELKTTIDSSTFPPTADRGGARDWVPLFTKPGFIDRPNIKKESVRFAPPSLHQPRRRESESEPPPPSPRESSTLAAAAPQRFSSPLGTNAKRSAVQRGREGGPAFQRCPSSTSTALNALASARTARKSRDGSRRTAAEHGVDKARNQDILDHIQIKLDKILKAFRGNLEETASQFSSALYNSVALMFAEGASVLEGCHSDNERVERYFNEMTNVISDVGGRAQRVLNVLGRLPNNKLDEAKRHAEDQATLATKRTVPDTLFG